MLTVRPWNANAIVRLVFCVVVCILCGSLVIGVIQHLKTGPKHDPHYYRLTISALGCAATAFVFVYRPWNRDNVVSRLGGYLVCLYGGILLGALAQKTRGAGGASVAQMIVASLSAQGAALILVPHFLREQQLSWREAFGFGNNRKQSLLLGFILACLFLPLGMGLQWLSAQVMIHLPWISMTPRQQESVQTLQMAVTWLHRVVLGTITIGLAPVAEEMFFRGILYPAIKQAGFPRLALWGSALLFAGIHMNLVTLVPLLVLALGLTLIYERTGNLLAPITAHALFNAMNFIILYSPLGPSPSAPN